MIKKDYNEPLIREDLKTLQNNALVAPSVAYQIVDYMDGNQNYWIKRSMAERFAVRFENKKDAKGIQTVMQIKDDLAVKMAIESNMQEVASFGLFKKIVKETANLNRNTSFKFVNESGDEDENVSDVIRESREESNFDLSLGRLDELAVGVGSAAMLIQVLANKIEYSPINRSNVYAVFSDYIFDGDREATSQRVVNKMNLQEATCVIIQLSEKRHVAYFGRSLFYPQGRMVTYESEHWYKVPEVGSNLADDYVDDGEIANPLTVYQDEKNDYSIPEYPLVLWYGYPTAYKKDLMPVDSSLYKECLEQDVSTSRALTAALKSARGAWHFSRENGASDAIPANIDEGFGQLQPGQTVGLLHVPGQNIDACLNAVEKFTAYISESYGVPAYKLSVSQNAQIPSGAALIELNKPSALVRETRYKLNKSGMEKIYQIEKALISIETGEDFGDGVEQVWTVHPEQVTKTNKEMLEEAKLAEDAGVKDKVQNVIDIIDGIETREQAEEYISNLAPAPVKSNGLTGFAQRAQEARGNATQ